MIHRPDAERDLDPRFIVRGTIGQFVSQRRIVQRQVVDRDRDIALVVAVAFQHGLESVEVAPGSANEREGADGRGLAQRQQVGGRLERVISRAVAGGGHVDSIRLRVSGVRELHSEQCDERQEQRSLQAHAADYADAAEGQAPSTGFRGQACRATALWRLTSRTHFLLMSAMDGGSPRE